MRVLSVDLGTSNTVAVLSAHGQPPRALEVDGSATMPSAVFATDDGGLIVGRDAERRARLDPARFEPTPKRRVDETTLLLGNQVITVTDAMAAVLHRVADETRRQLGGAEPDEVRLTHPAQWGPVRRNVLLSAARLAGFGSNLVLIPEPVAAAAHFASFPGRQLSPEQALGVYDLGAGTFDCAVVGATRHGFVVLAEDGLPDLGGVDVDQALLEHIGRQVSHHDPQRWQRLLRPESTADRRAERTLREDVKAAKETLSRHVQTEVPLPDPFEDMLITRAELEALVRPSMMRSVEMVASVVQANGMSPAGLAGLYLVGGSSRLPLVSALLSEGLRIVPTSLDQPETAVALGAHHVPRDGAALPTHDLGPATASVSAPGYQEPETVRIAPTPPHPPALPRRRKLMFGLAAAVLVVTLAAATAVVVLVRSSPDLPTAQECQHRGTQDSQGFTGCLRQLAGGVPDRANCVPGWQPDMPGLRQLDGTVVTCSTGDPRSSSSVVYTHLDSTAQTRSRANLLLTYNGAGDHQVQANWAGNGLTGSYRSVSSDTFGTLVFTIDGRPLVGMLVRPNSDHKTPPESLADEFERTVQPGTE